MLVNYIFLLSLVATGSALMCKMCDNYISCANEMSEHCPPLTQCYTIKSQGTVTHKGCAVNCASLPYAVSSAHCTTCNHRDNCNDEPSFQIGQGAIPVDHYGSGSHHRHHIGEGVRSSSSTAASSIITVFFSLLMLR